MFFCALYIPPGFSHKVRKVNYYSFRHTSSISLTRMPPPSKMEAWVQFKLHGKTKEVSKGENSAAKNDESFEQALVPLVAGDS